MPKIQIGKTKTVLLLYLLRVTAATVCCFGACCAVGALVVYKLDLDFKLIAYICAVIDFLCAFLIAKWALRGVKTSRLPLALAAIVPAMVLTVAHYCMAPSGTGLLVLRLLGMPVCAALAVVSNKRVHL